MFEVLGEVFEIADSLATVGLAALAVEFEVVFVHGGGVVEENFFVGGDVADGDEGDVSGEGGCVVVDDEAGVGGATVVDVVVELAGGAEVFVGGDLDGEGLGRGLGVGEDGAGVAD